MVAASPHPHDLDARESSVTHPSSRRRALSALTTLAILPAALGVAGCGKSDKDQAKSAVNDFLQDSVHPSAKLCDVVAKRVIEMRTGLKGDAALKKCRENADKAGKAGGNGNSLPKGLKLTDVQIKGSAGTVRAMAPGQGSGTFHVVKEDGKWKVDSAGA